MKKAISLILALIFAFSSLSLAVAAESGNFGCVSVAESIEPDCGTDVAEKIQEIIDSSSNKTVYFPDGVYLLGKPIYTPADPKKSVSLKLSDFAVLKAAGDWKHGEAVVQLGGKDPANDTGTNGSNYSLEGGIIDGSGVADGISINSGRETSIRFTSIKHTAVGIHIMYGANSGSSDADILGVNIIGNGGTDSIGILTEGHDNTVTNVRIGNVFTGVLLKSAGNMLRNVHPLYTSDYTDYQNSTGFSDECGGNRYDFCYSDQFAVGFRTTGNGVGIYDNCYCFWYSSDKDRHTAFKAEKKFNSILTNFTADFNGFNTENIVLSVTNPFGGGIIDNLNVNKKDVTNFAYKMYDKSAFLFGKIFGFFSFITAAIKN